MNMLTDQQRSAIALLRAREMQLQKCYVNGWYDLDEYDARLVEIHNHVTRVTGSPYPCGCNPCREARQ